MAFDFSNFMLNTVRNQSGDILSPAYPLADIGALNIGDGFHLGHSPAGEEVLNVDQSDDERQQQRHNRQRQQRHKLTLPEAGRGFDVGEVVLFHSHAR